MKKRKIIKNQFSIFIPFIFLLFYSIIQIDCSPCRKIIKLDTEEKLPDGKIYWAALKNGNAVVFDEKGGKYKNKNNEESIPAYSDSSRYVIGFTPDYRYIEIPFNEISEVQIDGSCFDGRAILYVLDLPIMYVNIVILALLI